MRAECAEAVTRHARSCQAFLQSRSYRPVIIWLPSCPKALATSTSPNLNQVAIISVSLTIRRCLVIHISDALDIIMIIITRLVAACFARRWLRETFSFVAFRFFPNVSRYRLSYLAELFTKKSPLLKKTGKFSRRIIIYIFIFVTARERETCRRVTRQMFATRPRISPLLSAR